MNVYDFDGTIYHGDSSVDFYLYCIRKKPLILLKSIGTQLAGAVLYKAGRLSKTQFKERYFCFLNFIRVDDALLQAFWHEKEAKIKRWYLEQKQPDDLVISASPDFLLRPICRTLGVSLIATPVDPATGRFEGENCRGEEKVRRFREEFPGAVIDRFYTDSTADLPLSAISRESFFVKGDVISPMTKT